MKEYTLIITMDTDEDVAIEYKGVRYPSTFEIAREFDDRFEAVDFIRDMLEVEEGRKATNSTKEWLDEVCECLYQKEYLPSKSGNQEYEAYFYNNFEREGHL